MKREMLYSNHASCGATKNCLVKKQQALVHREHDAIYQHICVQLDNGCSYVWCFEDDRNHSENVTWPWTEITKLKRVQKVMSTKVQRRYYLHCSCPFQDRFGQP